MGFLFAFLITPAFVLTVQLRFADGRPASGIGVHVSQGALRAGECVTDEAGRCDLSLTFTGEDEPILYIDGYSFAPVFGVEGNERVFSLWPEYLQSGLVAFVLDAPGAGGAVLDTKPEGAPLPVLPVYGETPTATETRTGSVTPWNFHGVTTVAPPKTTPMPSVVTPSQFEGVTAPVPTPRRLSPAHPVVSGANGFAGGLSATPTAANSDPREDASPLLAAIVVVAIIVLIVMSVRSLRRG